MTSVQGPGTLISEAFKGRGTHPGTYGEGRERTTVPCILQQMGHLVARVGLFAISTWRCFKTKNMTVADNLIGNEGITVSHWLREVLPTHSNNEGLSCRFVCGFGQQKHLSNWMSTKSWGGWPWKGATGADLKIPEIPVCQMDSNSQNHSESLGGP